MHFVDMDSNYKLYHLVRPSEHGSSDQQDKMVTEIYLTRQVLSLHSSYTLGIYPKLDEIC